MFLWFHIQTETHIKKNINTFCAFLYNCVTVNYSFYGENAFFKTCIQRIPKNQVLLD